MIFGAVVDKAFAVGAVIVSDRFGYATDFQVLVDRLQGTGGFIVDGVKLLGSTAPEDGLRFIPKFPITNVVVEAVIPTLVVVHGHVLDDICEFIRVGRRLDGGAEAAADAVINFRADIVDGGHFCVAGSPVVALGFFRVGVPILKNDGGVAGLHQFGSLFVVGHEPREDWVVEVVVRVDFRRAHGVVGADLIDVELFVLLGEIGEAGHHGIGSAVEALKVAELAGGFAGVDVKGAEAGGESCALEIAEQTKSVNREKRILIFVCTRPPTDLPEDIYSTRRRES